MEPVSTTIDNPMGADAPDDNHKTTAESSAPVEIPAASGAPAAAPAAPARKGPGGRRRGAGRPRGVKNGHGRVHKAREPRPAPSLDEAAASGDGVDNPTAAKPDGEAKPAEPSEVRAPRPPWLDENKIAAIQPLATSLVCTGISMACAMKGRTEPRWSVEGDDGKGGKITLSAALGRAGAKVIIKRVPKLEEWAEELTLLGLIGMAMQTTQPIDGGGIGDGAPASAGV